MKKNVAGQHIGAQMVSAADGTAFTGAVTVRITGDHGTQVLGSVASGICVSKGNGYHSYPPSQAETNFNHIAFTFTGTGAIPVTVQLYTEFPQTGDVFALIGAAGAGLTALGDARLANLDAAVTSRASPAQVNAEMLDVLKVDASTELSGVPPMTAPIYDMLRWNFHLAVAKITQTNTTMLVRNNADTATIGTSTVSDDGTTAIRGKFI